MQTILFIISGLLFIWWAGSTSPISGPKDIFYSYQNNCSPLEADALPQIPHLLLLENKRGVFFLEMIPENYPVTLNIIRSFSLGYFTQAEDWQMALKALTIAAEISLEGVYYRAHWHKDSCELLPVKLSRWLPAIQLDFYLKGVRQCLAYTADNGSVVFSCAPSGLILATSFDRCIEELIEQKRRLPEELLGQMGWEEYEY